MEAGWEGVELISSVMTAPVRLAPTPPSIPPIIFTILIPPSVNSIPARQWANGHWWCHVREGCAQHLPSIFLSLPTVEESLLRIVFLIKALFLGQKSLRGL